MYLTVKDLFDFMEIKRCIGKVLVVNVSKYDPKTYSKSLTNWTWFSDVEEFKNYLLNKYNDKLIDNIEFGNEEIVFNIWE